MPKESWVAPYDSMNDDQTRTRVVPIVFQGERVTVSSLSFMHLYRFFVLGKAFVHFLLKRTERGGLLSVLITSLL